jgi:hypothetical protein
MANDFSAALETAHDNFYERLGAGLSWYTQVGDVRMDDTPNLKLADLSGTTHFAAQVASPSAEDLDYGGTSVASAAYEKLHTVTHKDLRDIPGMAMDISNMLADAALSTIQNLFLTTLAALDSTTHPDDANYTATGGGTSYFADDHATPVAQVNLLTTALSASSLATARQTLREYLNKAGLPMALDMSPGNLRLVVPAALETTARDLTSSNGEIYDGSALQSRSFGGIVPVVIPAASDDNDWFLVHRPMSPIVMWIRQAPYIQITRAEATGHWHFYSQLESAVVLKPHEGGLVMSVVA